MSTTECSWRLCPSPGMYVVTSMPFERRTRATLRRAEFGFLGVVVYTRVQTPRRCGAATFFLRPLPDFKPGVASFFVFGLRPLRTSWDVVGIQRGWWQRSAGRFGGPGALTALQQLALQYLELGASARHQPEEPVDVCRRLGQDSFPLHRIRGFA